MDAKKWILVFDLDECIAKFKSWKMPILNPYVVDILKKAVEKKGKTVDAIFLLTNNSNDDYIELVHTMLKKEIGVPNVFDLIWSRYNKSRNKNYSPDPEKTLNDVKGMLNEKQLNTTDFEKRTIFLDDQERHPLAESVMMYNNFIHTVPFYTNKELIEPDYYKNVMLKLENQLGGSKKKRTLKRKRRKTLKKSYI